MTGEEATGHTHYNPKNSLSPEPYILYDPIFHRTLHGADGPLSCAPPRLQSGLQPSDVAATPLVRRAIPCETFHPFLTTKI